MRAAWSAGCSCLSPRRRGIEDHQRIDHPQAIGGAVDHDQRVDVDLANQVSPHISSGTWDGCGRVRGRSVKALSKRCARCKCASRAREGAQEGGLSGQDGYSSSFLCRHMRARCIVGNRDRGSGSWRTWRQTTRVSCLSASAWLLLKRAMRCTRVPGRGLFRLETFID